jgi:2-polyprenyl-3-methyl-5-hydroxy-6-metoxy-1,4-benzoquinol methylase
MKTHNSYLDEQEKVNTYFTSISSYWREVYASHSLDAEIFRDRHAAVLSWIDDLALEPGAEILEIGCGAGFMSVALAQRGYHVCAIDSVKNMVEMARQQALESGTSSQLTVDIGDVYSLAFQDEAFDLVIAIGVIPWLDQAELAMQEMARVTRPGGHIIFTTANRLGLVSLLDPLVNPLLPQVKQYLRKAFGRQSAAIRFHSCHYIDKALAGFQLHKIRGMTRGFPFTFFRRPFLPERLRIALHFWLQRLADRGLPGFRSIGVGYYVLARKSPSNVVKCSGASS